jgi:hypothetical protein
MTSVTVAATLSPSAALEASAGRRVVSAHQTGRPSSRPFCAFRLHQLACQ